MNLFFKVVILVFNLFQLRKKLIDSRNDGIYWELNPMDFQLDWFVEGSSEGSSPAKAKRRFGAN